MLLLWYYRISRYNSYKVGTTAEKSRLSVDLKEFVNALCNFFGLQKCLGWLKRIAARRVCLVREPWNLQGC